MGHGIVWNARKAEEPKPLDRPFDLPDEVAAGIEDVSKRDGWNQPAPDDYALPTETWREVVARRRRYDEVRAKLASGEVQEVNDLITLNLDIERFARDVITQSEGPELLRAFWRAMRGVSVLDPTCGSGAFLFSALNLLEPLYTSCLEGNAGLPRRFGTYGTGAPSSRRPARLPRRSGSRSRRHPSERYFILKSIVLNNLYGVDIMEEAVEICKLRLFLKLVAQLETYDQIEPLPDIDFNIRAGNTLVGFTSLEAVRQAMTVTSDGQFRTLFDKERAVLERIEEEAEIASSAFNEFRRQQTILGGEVTADDKADLRRRLCKLSDELDRCLATEYGVEPGDTDAYEGWRVAHQPFHWFVEFYGIMHKGGFDVIIGNPPYVEYSKVRKRYQVKGFVTERCGNLYAICIQRFIQLLDRNCTFGAILPISSVSTPRMLPLMHLLLRHCSIYVSNYAVRPAKLFADVDMNLSILIGVTNTKKSKNRIMTTRYNRWKNIGRDYLFSTLSYAPSRFCKKSTAILKSGSSCENSIFSKLMTHEGLDRLRKQTTSATIFYHSGGRYFRKCIREKLSNEYKELRVSKDAASPIICLLSSSLYYWLWIAVSDCYHVTRNDIDSVPVPGTVISDKRLSELTDTLLDDFNKNAEVRVRRRADGSQRQEVNYNVEGLKS